MNVNVIVGVPLEFDNESEALVPPPFPAKPPNAAALVVQDELDRLGAKVVGAPV